MNVASGPYARALFVGPRNAIPSSLLRALQTEFTWILAEHVGSIPDICRPFDRPVGLVAVDIRLARAAEAMTEELRRWHPDAIFVIIDHDLVDPGSLSKAALASDLFRSVLPMSLRLDTWLSVVGLLLHGGEYYPPSMFRSSQAPQADTRHTRPDMTPQGNDHARPEIYASKLAELTRRELQILAILASGMQNKAIATRLALSEHTVKVHVHHIINKLGANNRTEAALFYRQSGSLGLS